jgi:hypothetical protein
MPVREPVDSTMMGRSPKSDVKVTDTVLDAAHAPNSVSENETVTLPMVDSACSVDFIVAAVASYAIALDISERNERANVPPVAVQLML